MVTSTKKMTSITNHPNNAPYVLIREQPSKNSARFRYQCESRGGGNIMGGTSRPEAKTWPSIEIVNHTGPSVIVVSLVTADDEKPKPHPHRLVGDNCSKGVCTVKHKVKNGSASNVVVFKGLGIQCVKKNECAKELDARKQIRVDPFKTGFEHNTPEGIKKLNLNKVKLCFQVFLPDDKGKYQRPLQPITSDEIQDKKNCTELIINNIAPVNGHKAGGTKIILLTQKLPKDDLEVRFFKPDGSWSALAKFNPAKDIHQQCAVVIQTPPYTADHKDNVNQQSIKVKIELRKRSSDDCSAPVDFTYAQTDAANFNYMALKRGRGGQDAGGKRPRNEPSRDNPEVPDIAYLQHDSASLEPQSGDAITSSDVPHTNNPQMGAVQNPNQNTPFSQKSQINPASNPYGQTQSVQPQYTYPMMTNHQPQVHYPHQQQYNMTSNYQHPGIAQQPMSTQSGGSNNPSLGLSDVLAQMEGSSEEIVYSDVNLIPLEQGVLTVQYDGQRNYLVPGPNANPNAQARELPDLDVGSLRMSENGDLLGFAENLSETFSEFLPQPAGQEVVILSEGIGSG